MNFPQQGLSKLQFSIYAIASLMYLFKKQRDAFGLGLFASDLEMLSPARSTTQHLFHLFAQLEKAFDNPAANAATNITGILHRVAEELHQRSMVIIFSDMLENAADGQKLNDLFAAIRHLKYNKHEVIIFNVSDHHLETGFKFDNRPHHFIDLESGTEIKVHPNKVREEYLASLKQYQKQLALKCAQYKIDIVDADINSGYYEVLKAYLVKRNKMI